MLIEEACYILCHLKTRQIPTLFLQVKYFDVHLTRLSGLTPQKYRLPSIIHQAIAFTHHTTTTWLRPSNT